MQYHQKLVKPPYQILLFFVRLWLEGQRPNTLLVKRCDVYFFNLTFYFSRECVIFEWNIGVVGPGTLKSQVYKLVFWVNLTFSRMPVISPSLKLNVRTDPVLICVCTHCCYNLLCSTLLSTNSTVTQGHSSFTDTADFCAGHISCMFINVQSLKTCWKLHVHSSGGTAAALLLSTTVIFDICLYSYLECSHL